MYSVSDELSSLTEFGNDTDCKEVDLFTFRIIVYFMLHEIEFK